MKMNSVMFAAGILFTARAAESRGLNANQWATIVDRTGWFALLPLPATTAIPSRERRDGIHRGVSAHQTRQDGSPAGLRSDFSRVVIRGSSRYHFQFPEEVRIHDGGASCRSCPVSSMQRRAREGVTGDRRAGYQELVAGEVVGTALYRGANSCEKRARRVSELRGQLDNPRCGFEPPGMPACAYIGDLRGV